MEVQQTLGNWVDHVANGCCHVYMRHEKHDIDFTRYVVIEAINQLLQRYPKLPDDFYQQLEEVKQGFQVELMQTSQILIGGDADKRPGKILKLLKTERGIAVKETAIVLDCSIELAKKILDGEYPMSPTQIIAVAKRFSVSPAIFFLEVPNENAIGDFIVRASQELQISENMEVLSIDEIDCLINCSHAIAKLHNATNSNE